MILMVWLTSNKRKRHQRAINSLVRKINKNIEDDTLWRGRFYMRQVKANRYQYEDGSGMELYVWLECVDRKTGRTWQRVESVNRWRFLNGYRVWEFMNDFIIKYADVWHESPAPGEEGFHAWSQ